jgi:phosphoserine phosphatase
LKWTGTPYLSDPQGRFTSIGSVLEGQGKADIVIKLAQQMDLPLTDTIVYSDSYLDLPVLKIAGRAIGVKPDDHLKRICLQNGWEIL